MDSTLVANFVADEVCGTDEQISGGYEAKRGSRLTKVLEGIRSVCSCLSLL